MNITIDDFIIINNIKNKIKYDTYIKGTTVYYILNNKIKKGTIIKIDNNIVYVCRFKWFPLFKHKVVPGINCFKTKELTTLVLNYQQKYYDK